MIFSYLSLPALLKAEVCFNHDSRGWIFFKSIKYTETFVKEKAPTICKRKKQLDLKYYKVKLPKIPLKMKAIPHCEG